MEASNGVNGTLSHLSPTKSAKTVDKEEALNWSDSISKEEIEFSANAFPWVASSGCMLSLQRVGDLFPKAELPWLPFC